MQQIKPYFFLHNDHDFYFKTVGSLFQKKQCLKINRLTSKCQSLSEQQFQQETNQIPAKCCQSVYLIIGIISICQQPYLCLVTSCQPVGTFMDDLVYQIRDIKFVPFKYRFLYASTDQSDCEKINQGIRNDIVNQNFYFCYKQDITLNYDKKKMNPKLSSQRKYFWNQDLLKIFSRHKLPSCWRIPIMQGFVSEIHCSTGVFAYYYLNISRRSKQMSGTRFNSRGIDLNFNVANFVESQEIFMCHNLIFSHISVRGSVPIFWEQQGFGSDIRFSKENEESNQMVIKKHFEFLHDEYNADIVTVNLLSKSKSPEKQLKSRFQFYYLKAVKGEYLYYDLNEDVNKDNNSFVQVQIFVKNNLEKLVGKNNFFCLERNNNKIICRQKTVPRINCLDCLDRTNVVMARISQMYLSQVSEFINAHTNNQKKRVKLSKQFDNSLLQLWAQLGNQISRIYSGSESVASHLTKKQNNSFFSFFSSVKRYYNANISDLFKQECIQYFLAKKQQKSESRTYFQDNIASQILQQKQYCSHQQFGMFTITWNCNMVDPLSLNEKDVQKLFNFSRTDVDVIIVSLQQMVQLNSYNVILGNNQNVLQNWRKVLFKHINSHNQKQSKKQKQYQYLTSHDLVGIATFIFISSELVERVTNVQWFDIKTGFNGQLGNKGVIVLFLTIDSTPITIMSCHLAAGQSKSNERLQDIQFIHQGAIKQRRMRRFFDISEFRFFIGDFNFRLQAKNQMVRELLYSIQKQDQQQKLNKNQLSLMLQTLLAKDQFNLNRHFGALSTYNEADIHFMPTYKYVKRQKRYDTKRTPSWCDRILYFRKDKLKLSILKYSDIDVHLSDHKPVSAVFRFLCKRQDADKKKQLIQAYFEG